MVVRGPTPYVAIENEPRTQADRGPPAPQSAGPGHRLDPVPGGERAHLSVFGAGALNVSPRVGHLHIHVDDLPWLWADASDLNTIDFAGLPPGQHKVLIELVNANHQVFPGCATCKQTVTFTIPETTSRAH